MLNTPFTTHCSTPNALVDIPAMSEGGVATRRQRVLHERVERTPQKEA